ncbi:MAG: hypothetical protein MZV70_08705 [Desulfobacterales bacterium]|nr:hypothetical protein [Desulfobacterales bacterium]
MRVEVEYFIALCRLPLPQLAAFDPRQFERLRDLYRNASMEDAQRIKDIEKITNHDVKAVEYRLKEKFDELGLQAFKRVHPLRPDLAGHQQHGGAAVAQGGLARCACSRRWTR